MKFSLAVSIVLGALIIGGTVLFMQKGPVEQAANNVRMEGERQVIEISAKGGYSPKITAAKAGVPTTLKIKTDGTYDCSSALTIQALNYRKTLAATDVTDIEIPAQEAGSTIEGVCSMGMYSFSVKFL